MSNKINKYNIKIPTDISLIYSEKIKTLTFSGPLKKKSMKLGLKIVIDKKKKNNKCKSTTIFSNIKYRKKKD